MPNRNDHLKRAEENEHLATSLTGMFPPAGLDWAVAVTFYSALHYIDSYLAPLGRPLNHKHRDEMIENNGSISPLYRDYRRLKDMSRAARYEIACYSEIEFKTAQKKLANIKDLILSKLR